MVCLAVGVALAGGTPRTWRIGDGGCLSILGHRGGFLDCGCSYRRVNGGADFLPNCGMVVLRLTWCHWGSWLQAARRCELNEFAVAGRTSCQPTAIRTTGLLLPVEAPQRLAERNFMGRIVPACAAARETKRSAFPDSLAIRPPALESWISSNRPIRSLERENSARAQATGFPPLGKTRSLAIKDNRSVVRLQSRSSRNIPPLHLTCRRSFCLRILGDEAFAQASNRIS